MATGLMLAGCDRPLLQDLNERQANEVVAALLVSNIGAEKHIEGKAGFVVRVKSDDLASAIDIVQRQHLPSRDRMEISSAFPADALVSTPQSEKARLYSAIEQRLEQSLLVFGGVSDARVHVSYDTRKTSVRRDEDIPMHLSAVLVHEHGIDADGLIQSVKRFLRNSFARIDYNDISVVLVPGEPPRLPAITAARSGWGAGRSYIVSAWIVTGLLLALGVGWQLYRTGGLWVSKKSWSRWFRWVKWRRGKTSNDAG